MAKTKSISSKTDGNYNRTSISNNGTVFDEFRRWGYFEANLDPLGFLKPLNHPELRLDGEEAERARQIW